MSEIAFYKQLNTGTISTIGSGSDQTSANDNQISDWMKSEFDSTSPMPVTTDTTKIFGGEGRNGFIVKLDRSKPRANSNGKWVIRDERRTWVNRIFESENRFFFRVSYYFPSEFFQFSNDNREYLVLYQHLGGNFAAKVYIRVSHDGQFYIQLEDPTTRRHFVGEATLDTLHTFVIEVNFATDSNGYVNVWKDTPNDFAPVYNSAGELTISEGIPSSFSFLKRESEDFSRFNRVGKNTFDGFVISAAKTIQLGAYVPNPSLSWNSTNPFSETEPYDPDNLIFTPTYREFIVSGVAWLIPEPEWNRQDIVNFMFEVDPTVPPEPTEGFRARLRFPSEPTV
jgi:hypothetical protein